MTVLFTADADGHKIAERAFISRAPSKAAALKALRANFEGSDFEVLDIERGDFGDCWIRCADARTVERNRADWEAEAGELIVQEPGSHPGGRAWWVSPREIVWVPVLRERAA